jgi:hypothetical protein
MLPATASDIAVTILPATAALPAVAIDPATAVLATVAAELTTPALATVAAEPATAVLATVAAEPATAELATVATDPATAVLAVASSVSTRLLAVPMDLTMAIIVGQGRPVVFQLPTFELRSRVAASPKSHSLRLEPVAAENFSMTTGGQTAHLRTEEQVEPDEGIADHGDHHR